MGPVTVRVLEYRGDGTYYLGDPALELEGVRDGPAGGVLVGGRGRPLDEVLGAILAGAAPGAHALDVIVAAPKPLSVLLAIDPPRAAREVVALHGRAVDAVVDYLAREAGCGGAGTAPLAVGFTHGINRLGDPHLHTHVLVAALGSPGGGGIDPVRARSRAAAADALYTATLREGLPRSAGRDAWVGRSGTTLVEGVAYEVLAATTAPRDRRGRWVRTAEKPLPTRSEACRGWAARLSGIGDDAPAPEPPATTPTIDEHRFAVALGTGLVAHHDVVRAWATSCTRGAAAATVERAVALVAPGLLEGARCAAVTVRDDHGVRALGPRPTDLGSLERWREGRTALSRYLAAGHRLEHLSDPTGAPASTLLAVARFDAAVGRAEVTRGADRDARAHAVAMGRD